MAYIGHSSLSLLLTGGSGVYRADRQSTPAPAPLGPLATAPELLHLFVDLSSLLQTLFRPLLLYGHGLQRLS